MAAPYHYYIICAVAIQSIICVQGFSQRSYITYLGCSLTVANPRSRALHCDRTRGLWPQRSSVIGRKGSLMNPGAEVIKVWGA